MRTAFAWLLITCLLILAGCTDPASPPSPSPSTVAARVITHTLSADDTARYSLTGLLKAEKESPLAFEVNGRISMRYVNAGQHVQKGDLLFELDPRDLEKSVDSASAELAAATASLNTARNDLARHQELHAINAVSRQALERAQLVWHEAATRRKVALARLNQAQLALSHTQLKAPADGLIMQMNGEEGVVIASGTPVGVLAHAGNRDIEVNFPDTLSPPEYALLVTDQGQWPVRLRETSGTASRMGQTQKVRYAVPAEAPNVLLGSAVRVHFENTTVHPEGADTADPLFSVPIAAINERGQGAVVWRIEGQTVQPVPVRVLHTDQATARIQGPLKAGDKIVALGTHLLTPGQTVQERTTP